MAFVSMPLITLQTAGTSTALRGTQHAGMCAGRHAPPGSPPSKSLTLFVERLAALVRHPLWLKTITVHVQGSVNVIKTLC